MGPTRGPPGSCQPQMGPMLAPWTLLLGWVLIHVQPWLKYDSKKSPGNYPSPYSTINTFCTFNQYHPEVEIKTLNFNINNGIPVMLTTIHKKMQPFMIKEKYKQHRLKPMYHCTVDSMTHSIQITLQASTSMIKWQMPINYSTDFRITWKEM